MNKQIQQCYEVMLTLDNTNKEHSIRVGKLSSIIASRLQMFGFRCSTDPIIYALHDVGKVYIPEGIIIKLDKLTDTEFNIVKQHTIQGFHILKRLCAPQCALDVSLLHHENYDGSGYPLKLKASEIPLEARICRVVDSYDAIVSKRTYKDCIDDKAALCEINNGSGTLYDPLVVSVFQEIVKIHNLN